MLVAKRSNGKQTRSDSRFRSGSRAPHEWGFGANGKARRSKDPSLREESLVERVRSAMLEDIIQVRIQPGPVIQLSSLAERYGVSRTPIREALSILERQGLVQPIAYKGYLVRPIEPGDLRDVFFIRRLLEGAGAELAAERITTEAIKELQALHPPPSKQMTLAYDEYSPRFHLTIAQGAGSRRLVEAFERVYNDVRRLQYAGIRTPRPDLIEREHLKILEALNSAIQRLLADSWKNTSTTSALGRWRAGPRVASRDYGQSIGPDQIRLERGYAMHRTYGGPLIAMENAIDLHLPSIHGLVSPSGRRPRHRDRPPRNPV
jgi:DNA-binding GntR family transcriptional regulator